MTPLILNMLLDKDELSASYTDRIMPEESVSITH
jgi:hypothetical protein